MDPTQEQLDARLNPTPVQLNIPTSGVFFGNDKSRIFFSDPGGTFSYFEPDSLLQESERAQFGSFGGQVEEGVRRLSKMGFDTSGLRFQNMADVIASIRSNPALLSRIGSEDKAFIGLSQQEFFDRFGTAPPLQTGTQTLNTQQNQLAPQEERDALRQVDLLSSAGGKRITQENTTQLQQIEQQLELARQQALDIQLGLQTLGQAEKGGLGITPQTSVQQAEQFLGLSPSPASQRFIDSINQAAREGIRDEGQARALQQLEGQALQALSQAQLSRDNNDPVGLNTALQSFQQTRQVYEKQLAEYFNKVNTLRADRLKFMQPGQREVAIQKQLIDIRSQQQQFNLQTEEDKFREFEGQTLRFAGGRAAEIDIRASFKRQEMALQEQNLLQELGLEQELREFQSKAVDQQISDFKEDFELQTAVQDRIFQLEQSVIDKADKLTDEAKDTLSNILNSLPGFSFDDLSPQAQQQLNSLASAAGVPMELIKEGLRAQKLESIQDESKNFQFISGTKTQQSGVFDPNTGIFTPIGGVPGDGGAGGSLIDSIIENPFLFNTLSTDEKENLIPELTNRGFNFPRDLSGSEKEAQNNANAALIQLSKIKELIFDENGDIRQSALLLASTGRGELAFARSEVLDVIARMRTGAALTASEESFYKKQLPRALVDDAATIETKLEHWTALFAGMSGASVVLQMPGGAIVEARDMFDQQTRSDVRNAIMRGAYIIEVR